MDYNKVKVYWSLKSRRECKSVVTDRQIIMIIIIIIIIIRGILNRKFWYKRGLVLLYQNFLFKVPSKIYIIRGVK